MLKTPLLLAARAFALAALLLAPAWGAKPLLPGCDPEMDDAHLDAAVTKAQWLAQTCLIDGKLNPALGRRMLSPKTGPTYHCDYTLKNYGRTRKDGAKPKISVNPDKTRPEENTSDVEMRPIDLTVFHELLHAADDGTLRGPLFGHNEGAGWPDGIYGCEYVCPGFIDPKSYAPAYLRSYEAMVRSIPCPNGSAVCPDLEKYAWLCANGPPKLTKREELGQAYLENAICITHNLGSIDAATKIEVAKRLLKARADSAAGTTADGVRVLELIGFMRAMAWAENSGSITDRAWLSTFFAKYSCPGLP